MHSRLADTLSLSALFLLLISCQSSLDDPAGSNSDYEYFPLESGRYSVYDVDEKLYSPDGTSTQRTYQLKERIGAAYSDVTGQSAYRLVRYQRTTSNQPWQADSIGSVRIVGSEGIRTENGHDFVKLRFPLQDQLTWNGNRLNGFEPDMYIARNVNRFYDVQGKQFNNTVTVVAQDDSTLISQTKRLDVYARGVGLIYKERTHVHYCTTTPACIGRQQIAYGSQQVYRIRTYGIE